MKFKDKYENDNYFIKKLKISDFNSLYDVGKNPSIWEQHPENDRWKIEKFKNYFNNGIQNEFGIYGIFDKKENRLIGSSRYYDYNKLKLSIKVGFTFLIPEYWGTSANYQIKVLLLTEAFKNLKKVYFDIGFNNLRSRKAIEKLGAVLYKDSKSGNVIYELDEKTFFLIKDKNNQIELLEFVMRGCKKHPAYRAIRPATGNCHECLLIWDAKNKINFNSIKKYYDLLPRPK